MYQKILKVMTALAVMGFTAGQTMAAGVVHLSQPNPILSAGSPTLTLNLVGTQFEDGTPIIGGVPTDLPGIQSVDGAAFTFNWDPTVLQYTGAVVSDPNWDTVSINDAAAAAGTVDFVFLGRSVGYFGADFNLVDIGFNVVATEGTATDITFADIFGGFSLSGNHVPVTYVPGQVVFAPLSMPVPASVWLFGSGLLGLAGFARRRSAV